jgi:hypothetical protein
MLTQPLLGNGSKYHNIYYCCYQNWQVS